MRGEPRPHIRRPERKQPERRADDFGDDEVGRPIWDIPDAIEEDPEQVPEVGDYTRVPEVERPRDYEPEYAPPPVHPDDIPFDPAQDRKWRKDRGLPPRDYGDQDPDRKPGGDDPTIVDYTV